LDHYRIQQPKLAGNIYRDGERELRCANTYTDSCCYTKPNADSDANCNNHTNSDCYSNGNTNCHSDTNANAYIDSYTYTYTYADYSL
jgi:hypothetical protein